MFERWAIEPVHIHVRLRHLSKCAPIALLCPH
ncbi:hypothetical protein EV567_3027 [Streptomyces sp. BK239]|nr:hypothetical protein EV567_3027 [Streptomyces sp. BK239]